MPDTNQSVNDRAYNNPFKPTEDFGSVHKMLARVLGKDYIVRYHGELSGENERGMNRAYERISVSHQGGSEMVLDVRFLPYYGATKSPSIAIRQRGEVAEAAEVIYGAKAYRSGQYYDIKNPIDTLADVIRAGHEYYEKADYLRASPDKSATNAFTAVSTSAVTGRGGELLKKIRRKYDVAPASGLVWGEQGYSYYEAISQQVAIAWGAEKRYKEKQILSQSTPMMRYRTQTPLVYDPVHDVLQAARPWEYRRTTESGFSEEQVELARLGQAGLKTAKQMATLREAREEAHPVILQYNKDHKRNELQRMYLPTADEMLSKEQGGEYLTPETFGMALGTRGGRWFRQGNEPRLVVSSLITQTPFAAGAAYAAKGAAPDTDIYGRPISYAISMSKAIPLPWRDFGEWADALDQTGKSPLNIYNVIGKYAKANAPVGVKLGTVTTIGADGRPVTKPIFSQPRTYETQVDKLTLVVPRYYNEYDKSFAGAIPSHLTKEERAHWMRSQDTENELRALVGDNVRIEYSGTNRMYLSVGFSGKVDVSAKLGGSKESWLRTQEEGWDFTLVGGGVARTKLITQEVKSGGDLWLGAFSVQPYENRMSMIEMVDVRLATKIRTLVENGEIRKEDVQPTLIAKVYGSMIKDKGDGTKTRDFWSPREIVSKAIRKILDEQNPQTRNLNYTRYGIYKITDSTQEIGTEIIDADTKKWYEEEMGRDKERGDILNRNLRFLDLHNGLFKVFNKVPVGSYILPKVVGFTTEWPMGGGKIPTQAVSKMGTAYPELSKALHLTPQDILHEQNAGHGARAWANLMQSDRLRNKSVLGETMVTKDTLMIDKEMASAIYAEIKDTVNKGTISGSLVTENMVNLLRNALKSRMGGRDPDMLYFKTSQSIMPGTGVPKYLDDYDKATGASTTGISGRWISGILDLLYSESHGSVEPGSAYRRWVRYSENMLDKSSGANKMFSSIYTGRAVMKNYNILDFLKPNEAAISDAQLEAIARAQPGVRNSKDVQEFIRFINEDMKGYLPGFYHRIPSVGGVYAVKFLTAKKVKELYDIDINVDAFSREGTLWINRWMHESGIGDRDIDKALIWSGLLTKRVNNKLKIEDLITSSDEWKKSMARSGQDYLNEFAQNLGMHMSGMDGVNSAEDNLRAGKLVQKYSHLTSLWKDYAEFMDPKGHGFSPDKTGDFGWVRSGMLNAMAKMWAEIRARRGTSYNTIRFMEEAGKVLHIGGHELNQALGAYGIATVQSSLEATTDAAIKSPFEANFFSVKTGEQDREYWISMGLPSANEAGKIIFESIYKPGQGAPKEQVIINRLLMAYTSSEDVSNSMISYLFSTDMSMAGEIQQLLKGKKGGERLTALVNNKKIMQKLYKGNSVASLMAQFSLVRAVRNNPDAPIDLVSEMLGKESTGTFKTLAILRALRTGKELRQFTFEEMYEAANSLPVSPERSRIEGYLESMDQSNLTSIPIDREWGGLGKDLLRRSFREGLHMMRSSDFGVLASGIETGAIKDFRKNRVLYQKVVGMTASWIGDLYRLDKNIEMSNLFGEKEEIDEMRAGPTWEKVAEDAIRRKMGLKLGGGAGYFTGKIADTDIRFIPGFLKIEDGKLVNIEISRHTDIGRLGATWKAALNRFGLLSQFRDNPKEMRNVLNAYKKIYDDSRRKTGSGLPDLGDDFVDQALSLIGQGKTEARVLHIGESLEDVKMYSVDTGEDEVANMVRAVKLQLKQGAPEYIDELEKISKQRFAQLEGKGGDPGIFLKNIATKYVLPKGIKQSYLRLYSAAKFARVAGVMRKGWLEAQGIDTSSEESLIKGLANIDIVPMPASHALDIDDADVLRYRGKEFVKRQTLEAFGSDVLDNSPVVIQQNRQMPSPDDIRIGKRSRLQFHDLTPEQRDNARILGLDFETGWKEPGHTTPPALSMAFSEYTYRNGKIVPAGDMQSYLIQQSNLTEILDKEDATGTKLRDKLNLREEMWQDPTKFGYLGVLSPKEAAEKLASRAGAGSPNTHLSILGSNPGYDIDVARSLGVDLDDMGAIEANTIALAKKLGIKSSGYGLGELAQHFNIKPKGQTHTAETDVDLAARVYRRLLEEQSTTIGSTTLPLFSLADSELNSYTDRKRRIAEWYISARGGNPDVLSSAAKLQKDRSAGSPLTKGTIAEEVMAEKIARAQGLYKEVNGKVEYGPVAIGLKHDEQTARWSVGNTGVALRFAPDILGVDASGKVIQTSIKHSGDEIYAQGKLNAPEYQFQEAEYRYALRKAAEEGPERVRELVEPYLRKAEWFKKDWAGASESEQERIITQNVNRLYQGIKDDNYDVVMTTLTGEHGTDAQGNLTQGTLRSIERNAKPTPLAGEAMDKSRLDYYEQQIEPAAQGAADTYMNPALRQKVEKDVLELAQATGDTQKLEDAKAILAGNPPQPQAPFDMTGLKGKQKSFAQEALAGKLGYDEAQALFKKKLGQGDDYTFSNSELELLGRVVNYNAGKKTQSGQGKKVNLLDERGEEIFGKSNAGNSNGGNEPPNNKKTTSQEEPDPGKGGGGGGGKKRESKEFLRSVTLEEARRYATTAYQQEQAFSPLLERAEKAAKEIFEKVQFTPEQMGESGIGKMLTEMAQGGEDHPASPLGAIATLLGRGKDDPLARQVVKLLSTKTGLTLKGAIGEARGMLHRDENVLDYAMKRSAEAIEKNWAGSYIDIDQVRNLAARGEKVQAGISEVENIQALLSGEGLDFSKGRGAKVAKAANAAFFTDASQEVLSSQGLRAARTLFGQTMDKATALKLSAKEFLEANPELRQGLDGEADIDVVQSAIQNQGLSAIRKLKGGAGLIKRLSSFGGLFKGSALGKVADVLGTDEFDKIVQLSGGTEGETKLTPEQREMIQGARRAAVTVEAKGKEQASGKSTPAKDLPMTREQVSFELSTLDNLKKKYEEIDTTLKNHGDTVEHANTVWKDLSKAVEGPMVNTIRKVLETFSQIEEAGIKIPEGYGQGGVIGLGKAGIEVGQQLLARAAVGDVEAGNLAKKLSPLITNLVKQAPEDVAAGGEVRDRTAPGLGPAARRILGGFGLMYLRSMSGMITQGLTTGEKEAITLREQWGEAAGRASGISRPFLSAQARNTIMAGLYGSPSDVLATAGGLTQYGLGRSLGGAVTAGLGAFAMGEWLGGSFGPKDRTGRWLMGIDEVTGERKLASKYGALGALPGAAWLAVAAIAAGGIGDILGTAKNKEAMAFKTTAAMTGNLTDLDLAAGIGQLFTRDRTYREETLPQTQAIFGWSGAKPAPLSGKDREIFTRYQGMGLYDIGQIIRPGASRADIISKLVPMSAARITKLHPEYQPIAGDVAAFAAENNLTYEQVERILPQWQFGMANAPTALAMGQVFGQNAAMMNPQLGNVVNQLAGWQVTSQEKNALMQGLQFGGQLGYYGSTLNLQPDQWRGQLEQWSRIAGTRMGDSYARQANLYMSTYGTRGQAPAPYAGKEVTVLTPEYAAYGRRALELSRQAPQADFHEWIRGTYQTRNLSAAQLAEWEQYKQTYTNTWMQQQLGPVPAQYGTINVTTPAQQTAISFATQINDVYAQLYGYQTAGGLRATKPNYLEGVQQLTATEDMLAQAQNELNVYRMGPGQTIETLQGLWSQQGKSAAEQTRLLNQLRPTVRERYRGRLYDRYDYSQLTGGAGQQQLLYQQARGDIQANLKAMGITPRTMTDLYQPGVTNMGQALSWQAQSATAFQWYREAEARGANMAPWQNFAAQYSYMTPGQADWVKNIMGGNAMAIQGMVGLAARSPELQSAVQQLMGNTISGYGGPVDVSALAFTGTSPSAPNQQYVAPNGTPWGFMNLAYGGMSNVQVAQKIWGGNFVTNGLTGYASWTPGQAGTYGNQYSSGAIEAAVNGVTLPGGLKVNGQLAMQAYGSQMAYNNQMASIGNQMAQWNLNYAFTTGVGLDKYANIVNPQTGNPFGFNTGRFSFNVPGIGGYTSTGGGMWGLQDAQRMLGNLQQEWQFGAQQKSMAIQSRQFYENMGLQQRQMGMQRGWAQQDWQYQDQTRQMQWGWRQEDFQEQVRFMSGRERKLAERQMRRETISFGMEGDQIDKQRNRQKEMWKLEDERFAIQKKQFEENRKFQEEQLVAARAFYEERKRLEEESIALQRAMWTEQMDLQKKAMGIAAQAATDQKQFNDAMLALQTYAQLTKGDLDTLNEDSLSQFKQLIVDLGPEFAYLLPLINEMIQNIQKSKGNGSGPDGEPDNDRFQCWKAPCNGAWIYDSQSHHNATVHKNGGAAGINKYVFSPQTITVGEGALPEKVEVTPIGQGTYRSRWADTVVDTPTTVVAASSTPQIINVYIGNKKLAQYIIDTVNKDLEV